MDNINYYKKIITRKFPNYRFSWEILTDLILEQVAGKPYWLDIGAGANILIKEQPGAALAIGLDTEKPAGYRNDDKSCYVIASAYALPFKNSSFNFVTSRYTFEHLETPELALDEIDRIMRRNGIFILQTPNHRSPLVFLGSFIPFGFKKIILKRMFKDIPSGTYKTFYHFNRPSCFKTGHRNLAMQELILADDILYQSPLLFAISYGIFRMMSWLGAKSFANNIIAVYKKSGGAD